MLQCNSLGTDGNNFDDKGIDHSCESSASPLRLDHHGRAKECKNSSLQAPNRQVTPQKKTNFRSEFVSRGASGGCLHGGTNLKGEKAHFAAPKESVRRTRKS